MKPLRTHDTHALPSNLRDSSYPEGRFDGESRAAHEASVDSFSTSLSPDSTLSSLVGSKPTLLMQGELSSYQIYQSQYEERGLIAEGGQAKIYHIVDRKYGDDFIARKIPLQSMDDLDGWQRSLLAYRLMDHPGIAALYHSYSGPQGQEIILVMEYVKGETLTDFIKNRLQQKKPLSEDDLVKIESQLKEIVQVLHAEADPDREGIIHRDLKWDNVMMTSHGQIKVLDFGSVRFTGDQTHTATRKWGYSLFFAAPEQMRGEAYPESDLWAVGKILAYLALGEIAHNEENQPLTAKELLKKVSKKGLSRSFMKRLKKMLDIDPMKRHWGEAKKEKKTTGPGRLRSWFNTKTHYDNVIWDRVAQAIADNNEKQALRDLRSLVDVDGQDKNLGRTHLMNAIEKGLVAVVKALIARGADPNTQNKKKESALYLVVWHENLEVLRVLLSSGANADLRHDGEMTALMYAALFGRLESVRLLIEYGANMDLQNSSVRTALLIAFDHGEFDIIKLLIQSGANVDLQNSTGMNALMVASKINHYEIVNLLLDKGAQLDILNNNQMSALLIACMHNSADVAYLLIDRGAFLDFQDDQGMTALMHALKNGDAELAERLIEHGATLDLCDQNEWTALMYALDQKMLDFARHMMLKGASIHHVTAHKQTALSFAIATGDEALILDLVRKKVPVYLDDIEEARRAMSIQSFLRFEATLDQIKMDAATHDADEKSELAFPRVMIHKRSQKAVSNDVINSVGEGAVALSGMTDESSLGDLATSTLASPLSVEANLSSCPGNALPWGLTSLQRLPALGPLI